MNHLIESPDGNVTVTVDRRGWMNWRTRLTWWNPPEGPAFRSWTTHSWSRRRAKAKADDIFYAICVENKDDFPVADIFLVIWKEDNYWNRSETR